MSHIKEKVDNKEPQENKENLTVEDKTIQPLLKKKPDIKNDDPKVKDENNLPFKKG